jgi:hypothetical protein
MEKIGRRLALIPALMVAAAVLMAPAPALAVGGKVMAAWDLTGSAANSSTSLVAHALRMPELVQMSSALKRQPSDFVGAVDQVIADASRFVADYVPTRPGWKSGPVLGVSLSHKLIPVFFTGPE